MNMPSLVTSSLVLCAALALASPALAAKKQAAAQPSSPELAELTPEQLANADRVLLGSQACEFNQAINIQEVSAKKGYFALIFKGKTYLMAPEPTTTGAVRLEDKRNGLVWLQIANKSMLMNAKIGQRMVDNCIHPKQGA